MQRQTSKDRLISETIRNTKQKRKYKPEKERCDAITKENQIIEKQAQYSLKKTTERYNIKEEELQQENIITKMRNK